MPFSKIPSHFLLTILLLAPVLGIAAEAKTCLYVSSYHAEYEWDMGIRKGLESELASHCEIKTFFMDTKRNKAPDFAKQKAQEALQEINADILLTANTGCAMHFRQSIRMAALDVRVMHPAEWIAMQYNSM